MTLLGEVGMNGRLSVKALFVLVLLIGCSSKRDVGNVADQSGAPLTGSRSILVALWDLAAAGNQVCATAPSPVALAAARARSCALLGSTRAAS